MACRYTYQGKTYESYEFDDVLRAMSPALAAQFMPSVKAIPDAPFVGTTSAWLSLALKKVIHMAATNGYDKVAFVNGEQSADRYNLSKQIESVQYLDNSSGGVGAVSLEGAPGSGTLVARDYNGEHVLEKFISDPIEIENYVGKEVAKKLFEQKPVKFSSAGIGFRKHELSGMDLKVGGTGMVAFYDKIVPAATNKLLAKLGGGQMGTVALSGGTLRVSQRNDGQWAVRDEAGDIDDTYQSKAAAQAATRLTQPGFDITPAMREAASGGLPLFSKQSSATGLPITQVQSITDAIKSKWANAPEIVVLENMEDAPKAVRDENTKQLSKGATGSPEGFYYGGKVYVVASEMSKPGDVTRVVLHETLGHAGLRGVFGKDLEQILKQIILARKSEVSAKAKQYGLDMSKPADRLAAAEEVLAELAQTRPELGFVKRAIAAIRTWLRANMPGFADMKVTDAEVIQQFILPARQFVESGKPNEPTAPDTGGAQTDINFSRSAKQPAKPPPEETPWQGRQRVVQDKFNRFKVLQNWLNDNGVNLSEEADVYQAETLMSGKISSRKEDFRDNQMGPLIKKTQKADVSMEQVGDYLKAQHAPEANVRARLIHNDPDATAFGVTDQEATDTLDAFKKLPNFTALAAIANEWRDITGQTKQILLDGGILSQDMADAWAATYSAYVPVKGTEDAQGTGRGLSVNGKTKRRLGHSLRDEAIVENILRDHERAISLDEKNKVGKALIRFALEAKNEDIISVGKPEKRQVMQPGQAHYMVTFKGSDVASFKTLADARQHIHSEVLQKQGAKSDFGVDTTHDIARVMMQASPMLSDNEVTVYVAGHVVRVQINDDIAARAYINLGVEHLNAVLSAGREVNNWLSKAYTGYSPDFILTNPIRDAIQGSMTLTGVHGAGMAAKIFARYPHAVKELVKHFNKSGSSALVTDYRANGGSTGGAYLSDLERIGNDLQASYNEYAGMVDTYNRTYEKAIDDGKKEATAITLAVLKSGLTGVKKIPLIGHALSLMERINAITENALRVATYDTLVQSGVSKGKAAAQAKNLMNFNRKGEIANQAGALYLFFNPNVQGTQVMHEALVESKHKGQVHALVGTMVVAAIAMAELARAGGDDEEDKWKNTPAHVKDGNWVIGFGNYQATLTLPYGYRVFHTLGNVISDYAHGVDGYKLGIRLASSVFANFSPMGNPMEGKSPVFSVLPTLPKMALGPAMNEDSFGREVAPRKWSDAKPDSQVMYRNTKGGVYAQAAEGMNQMTGGSKFEKGMVDVSPETLKFWVKSLTGGAGQAAFDLINVPAMLYHEVPPSTSDVPVVRRFVREVGIKDSRAAFWDRAKEAKEAADAFSAANKAGDAMAVQSILKDKRPLLTMSEYANAVQKMNKAKRDEMDRINADKVLTFKQKNEQVKLLEAQEGAVYLKFIKAFDAKTQNAIAQKSLAPH